MEFKYRIAENYIYTQVWRTDWIKGRYVFVRNDNGQFEDLQYYLRWLEIPLTEDKDK